VTSFRLTKKAVDDLRSIGRYTQSTWGHEQRNKYLSKLDDAFHVIAKEPYIGIGCDYIRKGYRKYHVGRHLIFYRQTEDHVEIVRILHDRMDVESHIENPQSPEEET
jgi:toxin ParE1/3/4